MMKSASSRKANILKTLPESESTPAGSEQECFSNQGLSKALKSLDPDEQMLIVLTEKFGYSLPEMAGVLGLSEEKVRKRLQRAKLNLLSHLK